MKIGRESTYNTKTSLNRADKPVGRCYQIPRDVKYSFKKWKVIC
jgi:hypothetical protein